MQDERTEVYKDPFSPAVRWSIRGDPAPVFSQNFDFSQHPMEKREEAKRSAPLPVCKRQRLQHLHVPACALPPCWITTTFHICIRSREQVSSETAA